MYFIVSPSFIIAHIQILLNIQTYIINDLLEEIISGDLRKLIKVQLMSIIYFVFYTNIFHAKQFLKVEFQL